MTRNCILRQHYKISSHTDRVKDSEPQYLLLGRARYSLIIDFQNPSIQVDVISMNIKCGELRPYTEKLSLSNTLNQILLKALTILPVHFLP